MNLSEENKFTCPKVYHFLNTGEKITDPNFQIERTYFFFTKNFKVLKTVCLLINQFEKCEQNC